jgi:hypothetical protein
MPGIIPSLASSRKHVLHSPKSRMNPRFRPHLKQRFTILDENFGFLLLRAIVDVFAIVVVLIKPSEYHVFVRKYWFSHQNLRRYTDYRQLRNTTI